MIVETQDFALIADLESQIPEFDKSYPLERIEARLKGREYLALLAKVEGQVVAYKVGYAETDRRFYSWIGGVLPEYRKRGIARKLLHHQEGWCRENGYTELKVWSENRYRSMLIFLLTERYDIFAVSAEGQIMFRKLLLATD